MEAWRLDWDAFGRLVFHPEAGEPVVDVRVVRAFPVSSPDALYSICSTTGEEVVAIQGLESVSDACRAIIEKHLSEREFLPEIERICEVSSLTEPSEWKVITNRGNTCFVLENENDIRRIGDHQVMISDAQGIRYLIKDRRKMDRYSQRKLEWYVG